MKLHNSIGPNPRLVRMFVFEKGVAIPRVEVDLMGGEERRERYLPKYAAGATRSAFPRAAQDIGASFVSKSPLPC